MTSSIMLRPLGWALIAGAIVFWIGAATPPYRQWTAATLDEYLSIIGASVRSWTVMHILFAAGTAATLAALSGLARAAGDRVGSTIAITLLTAGAVLWMFQVGFRLSVTPWAAAELARTGAVPPIYAALHGWMGVLFAVFMVTWYLATAALGVALLGGGLVPRWVSLGALVFGLIAVPGLATPVFQPPLMLFVVPFILGVTLVR